MGLRRNGSQSEGKVAAKVNGKNGNSRSKDSGR